MIDDTFTFQYRLITLSTAILSCIMLARRWHRQVFLSSAGGLHSNILIFMGAGAFCYSLTDCVESIQQSQVMESFVHAGWYWLIGYSLACIFELKTTARPAASKSDIYSHNSVFVPLLLLMISFAGYAFSIYEVASSGAGTILIIFKGFLYPCIIIIILSIHERQPASFVPAVVAILVIGYYALFAPWQSELMFVLGAIGIGLSIRNRKLLVPLIVAALVAILFVTPFLNYKKNHYAETLADPFTVFRTTLEIPVDKRAETVGRFYGIRSNAAREMGYVQHAIEHSKIELRDGQTYVDATQQLVPRVFWPDKPFFNSLSNVTLPRRIGLVSADDKYTSWGVSLWAELLWNFHPINLVWFVPVILFLCHILDEIVRRYFRRSIFIFMASSTLFFLLLQIVSVVPITTYTLWTLIVLKIGDVLYSIMFSEYPSTPVGQELIDVSPMSESVPVPVTRT